MCKGTVSYAASIHFPFAFVSIHHICSKLRAKLSCVFICWIAGHASLIIKPFNSHIPLDLHQIRSKRALVLSLPTVRAILPSCCMWILEEKVFAKCLSFFNLFWGPDLQSFFLFFFWGARCKVSSTTGKEFEKRKNGLKRYGWRDMGLRLQFIDDMYSQIREV